MTNPQQALVDLVLSMFADRPVESVTTWAEREVRFNEAGNRGPFSATGREYVREPLDAWSDSAITDQVLIWGSQLGKSASVIMAGAAWVIVHEPSRIFWVGPTTPKIRV